jgi:hypothetical protein
MKQISEVAVRLVTIVLLALQIRYHVLQDKPVQLKVYQLLMKTAQQVITVLLTQDHLLLTMMIPNKTLVTDVLKDSTVLHKSDIQFLVL